ncbi:DNA-binding response regulator [Methylophaga thalassica]|uniref:DNA-binding response regulator n=1 Tax=Methylophaga thalassica TaxID=40223 RepID=A0ABQ5TUF6_9GAMM|nr:response regulator transcription factor [Methylophaga thalassica]GLP99199.1 DNA-binding response regulator [Methylophaga thalassica]
MKLLIADDHELYRDALVMLITQHFSEYSCTEATSFDELIQRIQSEQDWSAFIVDLHMPGLNFVEGIKQIKTRFPDVPLIVITSSDNPEDTQSAMAAGALGYILKSMKNEEIIQALTLILNHGISIHPAIPSEAVSNNTFDFTPRQQEVFAMMSKGASNKRIALDMGLSESTVKIHVRAILNTLQVSNRTEAVLKAKQYLDT